MPGPGNETEHFDAAGNAQMGTKQNPKTPEAALEASCLHVSDLPGENVRVGVLEVLDFRHHVRRCNLWLGAADLSRTDGSGPLEPGEGRMQQGAPQAYKNTQLRGLNDE